MDYKAAFADTLANQEFVANYDRLTNSSLGQCLNALRAGGLNHQVDVATGRFKQEIQKFDAFFFDVVWSRLPPESFCPSTSISSNP